MMNRLSIAHQATIALLAMLLAACGVLYFWATSSALQAELAHTRTVADMTESFRTLASKHGGFYVRRPNNQEVAVVGRYLDSVSTESHDPVTGLATGETFHQKNPFLALADYSEVVAQSPAQAKFRIVSDNYMNPSNAPDLFETSAIERFKAEFKDETAKVEGGSLRYARPIKATAACLKCHGDPKDAPAAVRTLYPPPMDGSMRGGGYGYREGEVVGLTSVTVPHKTPAQMIASQGATFWIAAVLLLTIMGLALLLVLQGIVAPIRQQTEYAQKLALAQDPSAVPRPRSVGTQHSMNELHQQGQALLALQETLSAVQKVILRQRRDS